MQGQYNHGNAYYRCRFPQEYALANQVAHPSNVYLAVILNAILGDAARLGFGMSCENRTGALLAVLAASKPGGRLLELGTGVGAGTAWLLDAMTDDATLTSVEHDPAVRAVALARLGDDPRLELVEQDAADWLTTYDGRGFDLAYVDCRPGKFPTSTS